MKFSSYNVSWKQEMRNEDAITHQRLPNSIVYEKLILTDIKTGALLDGNNTYVYSKYPIQKKNGSYIVDFKTEIVQANDIRYIGKLITLRKSLSEDLFNLFLSIEELLPFQGCQIRNTGIEYLENNHIVEKIKEHGVFKKEARSMFIKGERKLSDISERDLDKIKKWCMKYGYPYSIQTGMKFEKNLFNKVDTTTYSLNKKPLTNNQGVIIGFDVWDFLLQLHIFYDAYSLFRKIKGDECFNLDFKNYSVKHCEKILEEIYSGINLRVLLDFRNDREITKDNVISYKVDTIFDLALFSLFSFETFYDGEFKECPICHDYFLPERYNQVYCNVKPCVVSGEKCKEANCKECQKRTCYPQLAHKRKLKS